MYTCVCDFKSLDRWESVYHKRYLCIPWDRMQQHQKHNWQKENAHLWRTTITVTRADPSISSALEKTEPSP